MTVEPFKEGGEGVWTMGPKQEYIVNKPQPWPEFIEHAIKVNLLEVAHEQDNTWVP